MLHVVGFLCELCYDARLHEHLREWFLLSSDRLHNIKMVITEIALSCGVDPSGHERGPIKENFEV
jgi:hypothetical protein